LVIKSGKGDQLTIAYQMSTSHDSNGYGVEQVKFSDGVVWNNVNIGTDIGETLTGTTSNDILDGKAGNDTLDGLAGADTLRGGLGKDIYKFGRRYGVDTVVENDANKGSIDIAQFLAGVTNNQLWFRHVGTNLEVSVIGTTDKMVVKDWYLGSANHVEQFKTTDGGKTLLDTKVENLVSAMAAFAPPTAGQTSLPTNYQTALTPVIAANWQ
jgi:trimeric autotransporter adhesin